ncbi:MAG: sugar ABC transporter permease [Eubacterium sp.]|jgi:ABC-type sugar transport systems, permease components|nr:sugar ABC transporter permease [Eubacterium sp.]
MSDFLYRKNKKFYLALLLPALVLYGGALVCPLLFGTLPYSFLNWNLMKGKRSFTGLTNYIRLFSDEKFIHAVCFTILLAVISILFSNLLAFAVAFMLDQNVRAKGVIRSFFFIPNIISGVMVAFVWSFIFTNAIPNIGQLLHIDALSNISWFGNPRMSMTAVVIVTAWQSTGFLMMLYVAGLQTIPKDVIEAAMLDGCVGFSKILKIQLPLLMPTVTINLFVSIAGAFKSFDIPLSLTGGGPANSTQTIALNIYTDAFGAYKTGYASAKSMLLFLIVAAIAFFQLRITRKREVQM